MLQHEGGVTEERWWGEEGDEGDRPDLAITPPYMTRVTMPPDSHFPDQNYWLAGDAHYVVIKGPVVMGSTVLEYGDLYWVMGGQVHGPLYCTGDNNCVVMIASTQYIQYRLDAQPSDDNPSVDPSLVKERSYRLVDGGGWHDNPSPHSRECLDNGGVQNMMFRSQDNSPPVLRVRWSPSCAIPYHYHPTGALYFIQYGVMMFQGDGITPDVPFFAGEARWVRPGYAYGPEYNSDDEAMEITVLGTDTPPTFHDPPPGPYKVQKDLIITRVFDEL